MEPIHLDPPATPEMFRLNRTRFVRQMLEQSVAVFCSNDLVSSNGESSVRFRQNPDLYYLTGVTQPDTVLVLAPDTAREGYAEVLFIRRPDHRDARQRGQGLSIAEASERSGIQRVCFVDELDIELHRLILLASRIYVNGREDAYAYSDAATRDLRFAERLMKQYPAHKYHRAQPILKQIGMVKSRPEIALISRANQLAHEALVAAAAQLRPGNTEYRVEAAATEAIIAGGAEALAHPVKVASGANSLYPNYDSNRERLADSGLVQIQIGVRVAGYHASIARVMPLGDGLTERQHAVYERVVGLLDKGIALLLPGTTLSECERQLRLELEAACRDLGLAPDTAEQLFPTTCYHHVGRNLYDPYDAYAPLQRGMVIACGPALYLPGEGFGMQLRDVVLVTDDGPVDLSADVPVDLTEIEQMSGMMV